MTESLTVASEISKSVDQVNNNGYHKKENEAKRKLIDKKFVPRNSIFTDLFDSGNPKAVYNFFLSMSLFFFLDMVIKDIISLGSIRLDGEILDNYFGNNWITFLIWGGMLLSSLNVHFLFIWWARTRRQLESNIIYQKIWDKICLSVFILHQMLFIFISSWAVITFDLRPASSLTILLEQSRMLMKVHAYVRSNASKVTSHKIKNEDKAENLELPNLSKMLYFMFAPTLVYKEEYPRTTKIRWSLFFKNCAEIFGCFFVMHFIFSRIIIPKFSSFEGKIPSFLQIIHLIIHLAVPTVIWVLALFYIILHSVQNAMGELLRFADRQFYKDWWNCRSWSEFYRNWNVVVHDWLYIYVYKDMYENVTNQRRLLSQFSVFFVSALFHELVAAVSLRFFYPLFLVMFGAWGFFVMLISRSGLPNSVMLFSWMLGQSIMWNIYGIELYARRHCAPHENPATDFFLPRSWDCKSY